MGNSESQVNSSCSDEKVIDFEYVAKKAPVDAEGFVHAFYPPPAFGELPDDPALAPSQSSGVEEIQSFFEEYGFVVIREAVPEQLLNNLIDDIWSTPHLQALDRNDPNSWAIADWNMIHQSQYNLKHGFMGFDSATSGSAQKVRELPAMHRIFAALLHRKDIWFKFDRFGIMRPTHNIRVKKRVAKQLDRLVEIQHAKDKDLENLIKGVRPEKSFRQQLEEIPIGEESDDEQDVEMDRPEWKTSSDFVHWDLNPWKEPKFCRVQGVVALSNHSDTSGGFHCIPGFHKKLSEWARANSSRVKASPGCLIDLATPSQLDNLQRVTMRPGSIVVWDSRLPHGNWPNDDDQFRLVFYLTYHPAWNHDAKVIKNRRQDLALSYDLNQVSFSQLGDWVTGNKPYPLSFQCSEEDSKFIDLGSEFNMQQWGLTTQS